MNGKTTINDTACLEAMASLVERGGKLDPKMAGELRRIGKRLEELEAFLIRYNRDMEGLRGSVTEKMLEGKIVMNVGIDRPMAEERKA